MRHPRETTSSRLTSHYVFGLFKQSRTSLCQHRQCWSAPVRCSDTFQNESERKDDATWNGSVVSCSLRCINWKDIYSRMALAGKQKEQKQSDTDIDEMKRNKKHPLWHTHTHTVTLPGFKHTHIQTQTHTHTNTHINTHTQTHTHTNTHMYLVHRHFTFLHQCTPYM